MRKRNHIKFKIICIALFIVALISLLFRFLKNKNVAILQPAGTIATQQKNLLMFATILSMVVILPVFALTIFIIWKYRATNKSAKYSPDWAHNRLLETLWWGIPVAIITVLSIVTWQSSYALDPYKPLASSVKPLTIQVISLDWKWLFIYPDQNIASVNYVQFPQNVPINFVITSDAPMNSFWIPNLGGQVYAMAGMETQLHLMADKTGNFPGSSANISGEGFAGMRFAAVSTTPAAFNDWVASVKSSPNSLTMGEYSVLAQKSQNNPTATYATVDQNLYATVLMKYMSPGSQNDHPHSTGQIGQ